MHAVTSFYIVAISDFVYIIVNSNFFALQMSISNKYLITK